MGKHAMIPDSSYEFSAPIWVYQGNSTWHFITLPVDIAAQIRGLITSPRRGWGSIRVAVTLGESTWKTSIFPYKEVSSFILPLKAAVRKKEHAQLGNIVAIRLVVLE